MSGFQGTTACAGDAGACPSRFFHAVKQLGNTEHLDVAKAGGVFIDYWKLFVKKYVSLNVSCEVRGLFVLPVRCR